MVNRLDPQTERVAEALRDAIRRQKSSQRKVERALSQGKGYLSQLFNGKADLKLKHVFSVLGVIGISPEDFFVGLYDRSDPVGSVRSLVSRAHLEDDLQEIKFRLARLEGRAAAKPDRAR
jgi:transcriptional regulator with XRE-family HTH domain